MTVLIIEDEPRTEGLLIEFIKLYDPSINISYGIESIVNAVKYLENCKKQPDLIFMDIELSDGNSFEIFELVDIKSPVIFCTAYEEFTLKAFKNNGVDYILKPFSEEDIKIALTKIISLKSIWATPNALDQAPDDAAVTKKTMSHFLVNYREKMYPISVNTVAIFFIEEDQVYLLNFKNEKYPLQRKIDDIEASVNPALFFRISRQVIVNREAIESIETYFNRKLFIKLRIPTTVKPIVSRLKVNAFVNWIETS